MKTPKKTPKYLDLHLDLGRGELFKLIDIQTTATVEGAYLHWDELLRREPPEGLSHQQWWTALKYHRQGGRRLIPLRDAQWSPFSFTQPDPIPEGLHRIDLGAGGRIEMPDAILNPETRDSYYVSSLIEEAITSSQLEGAATTRLVAKEMLMTNRPPRDRNERMILNNFLTMKKIGELKREELSKDLVLDLHRTVTFSTLGDDGAAGRLRRADERVIVEDPYGEVFHEPPAAEQLEARMEQMCQFANGATPSEFVHPVIRSIILHFWLAYDHPFVDGNGRTARALFYWSMLHHGFWLSEFISISNIILKGPARYGRAFLHTETDENDLTYFILYHLEVIQRAFEELHHFITQRTVELNELERHLSSSLVLNHRQRALLSHAMRRPGNAYTISSHQRSHDVVYQTARTDLIELEKLGFLKSRKIGKRLHFRPVKDLVSQLKKEASR